MRLPTVVTKAPTQELQDLVQVTESLSLETQSVLLPRVQLLIENEIKRQRLVRLLHEALVQLRLEIKYLSFDCEATRQERDHFRRMAGPQN